MSEQPAANPELPPPEGRPEGATSLSLLERARASDGAARQRVVQLYRPLVLAWCRGGVRGTDAEDVAQEVLTSAFIHLGQFRRDRPEGTFRGWLRAITRNQVLLHFRRNQGRAQAEGGSDAWAELQAVVDPLAGQPQEETADARALYRRAMELVRGDFEEQTWQAFWLTVVEGRSAAVLAPELGMTPAGVRQAKARVLRRLKDELGELLD
jgi:RNA polymerase sigma-70 factor (ECF subfamily)